MSSDWITTTLDTTGKIVTGKTPPTVNSEYYGGEVPFITPSDFDGRRIIDSTGRYLTNAGTSTVSGAILPPMSVMVSCIGSDMGKVALNAETAVTNQQINSIIVNKENDPLFIYYSLLPRKSEIRSSASGSAQPILNKSAFGRMEIMLPPRVKQSAIAKILGALDDKIELNRKMNETLEAMARATFKSWFIDFDPVRAKMDGRWKKRQSLPGLPPEFFNLFPDRFEGELPSGWGLNKISEICEVRDGTHDSPKQSLTGNPLVTSKHIKDERVDLSSCYLISDEDFQSVNRRSQVHTNDILITMIGTVGNLAIVKDEEVTFAIKNVGLFKTSQCPDRSSYLYYFLKSEKASSYFNERLAGSTQQFLSLGILRETPVVMPPPTTLDKLGEFFNSVVAKKHELWRECDLLASIRDNLIPGLVSGQIRIKDTEKFLKERGL